MMAMATILQEYTGASDAEVVELTVMDKRWQLVLGRLDEQTPAFSQGAFWHFRERLIRYDLDQRLLERTREVAKSCGGFDWKALPKKLRVAMDSSPLEGAGRVEDTLNLLGHAAKKIIVCAASMLDSSYEEVAQQAGIPLLLSDSIKSGLDLEWDKPNAVQHGLNELCSQLDSMRSWLQDKLGEELNAASLRSHLDTLAAIEEQDTEPDPTTPGGRKLRRGTAKDRRISIEDKDMRHGRKTAKKRFDGFKRHLAVDLDTGLILACALAAANDPEQKAGAELMGQIQDQGMAIDELFIDRGYISSPIISEVREVICRPWKMQNNNELFVKTDFNINVRDKLITCPAGQTQPFEFGQVVKFDASLCDACPLRSQCTAAKPGRGRTVRIANDEKLQKRLRRQAATAQGRQKLRERVMVEHKLAHISQRQGRRALYFGIRKNLFDLRRAAVVQNLEAIQLSRTEERNAA